MDLREVQEESHKWRMKNFPDCTAEDQLMGMMEELGEIAHAFLKRKQGIRGTAEEHTAKIQDGVGDLFIFAMGFCSLLEIDLQQALDDTWEEVKLRNWTQFFRDGVSA